MTINREWVKILKTQSPSAFSAHLPQNANIRTVFIDGQIKLMKSDYVQCWKQFVRIQFISYIEQAFSNFNNEICVLAFDNYDFVPSAKGPTQRLRNKTKVNFNFDGDELPSNMPPDWGAAMRNRTFKTKVIAFVINEVRQYFQQKLFACKRTLVIDFKSNLQIFGHIPENNFFTNIQEHCLNEARGECDVKAFDWVDFGPTVLMSTDGDYIPIALLQQCQNKLSHDVFIFRMAVKCSEREKRSVQGSRKHEYEFVHVQQLARDLNNNFNTFEIEDLVTCIALSGCDFAMNLPLIGPQKLWKSITETEHSVSLTTAENLQQLVLRTYAEKFLKRERQGSYDNYTLFVRNLEKTSTAQKHVAMLWPEFRLQAHCKNVLWTIQYWTSLNKFPDALQTNDDGVSKWGFVQNKNVIVFDGQTPMK